MRPIPWRRAAAIALAAIGLILLAITLRNSGDFLIVDNRQKSDAIVVTQADSLDSAYWVGLHLLLGGYGREMFLDARKNRIYFGRNQAEEAEEFIRKTAAGASRQVNVCAIAADTTAQEAYEVGDCLKGRSIRSVLLVVDDFHSRRSLAMFSRLLPQYHWSIAPVRDAARFNGGWWRKRVWVRTAVVEWQHLLWWELLDRWRYAPMGSST